MSKKWVMGEFWAPQHPGTKHFGALRVDGKGGPRLRLYGRFDELTRARFQQNPSILLGTTVDSKAVTLLKCFPGDARSNSLDLDTVTFHIGSVVEGTHIRNWENLATTRLYVRYTYLEEWMGIHGYHQVPKEDLVKHFAQIAMRRVGRVGPFTLSLVHNGYWDNESIDQTYRQRAALMISSRRRQPLESFYPIVSAFRCFLALAMSQRVQVDSAHCLLPLYHWKPSKAWRPRYETMRLRGSILGARPSAGRSDASFPLVPYHLGSSFLRRIISRWLERSTLLEPVHDLYWQTAHDNANLISYTFLSMAQALETFHRRTEPGQTRIPKAEFKKLRREVLDAVPEPHRDWLEKQVTWANDPFFATRLQSLFKRVWPALGGEFPMPLEDLVRITTVGRNYFTHYSGEGRKRSRPADVDILAASKWLTVLLELNLLLDSGVTMSELTELVKGDRASRSGHYARWRETDFADV